MAKPLGDLCPRVLVVEGDQDLGKSFISEWLCSVLPDYFLEKTIDTNDKDSHVRLISHFLWEVAELGATTRKSDREALKAFITQRYVTVRKPYGRADIKKLAMASLYGTINNESGFLKDPTGNRRFLVVPLTYIRWQYSEVVDVHQLWAQAMHLLGSSETGRLSQQEVLRRSAINKRFESVSAVKDFLFIHFKEDPNGFEASAYIVKVLQYAGYRGTSRQVTIELANVARAEGYKEGKRRFFKQSRVRGYTGLTYSGERCDACGEPDLSGRFTRTENRWKCFVCNDSSQ